MNKMSDINQYILGKTADGTIDRNMGMSILKKLSSKKEKDDIAVIGIECRYSQAGSKEEYWENLINGLSSIRDMPYLRAKEVEESLGISHENSKVNYVKMGYLNAVDEFDPGFFRILPREAACMEPKQRLFLEVFYNALEDAGYAGKKLYGSNTGIFVGVDHASDIQFPYKSLIAKQDMVTEIGSTPGVVAGRPAYIFDLHGPAVVSDTACSSAHVSVHFACQALMDGDCDMAVVGGINLMIFTQNNGKFSEIESDCVKIRTFDRKANGTNWGEGVGAIVLKPLKKAMEDRDNIYAVIKSSVVNNDGASNGITAPNPEAQEVLIQKAWKEANIDPETISYIEAHGTGTTLGDSVEVKGISNAFRKFTSRNQFCGIGSVKPNIGHTVAASGLASIIKVLLSMKNGVIPPSINFEEPNRYIKFTDSPIYIMDRLKKWDGNGKPLRAGVNSFGFSGTNGHIILESAPTAEKKSDRDELEVFTVSVHSVELMQELILRYLSYFEKNKDVSLSDVCFTGNTGRRHCKYRLAFLVSTIEELQLKLKEALQRLHKEESVYIQANAKEKESLFEKAEQRVKDYLSSGRTDKEALQEIAVLYEKGLDIDWYAFYEGQIRYRINLPVSPFCKTKFWAEKAVSGESSLSDTPLDKMDFEDWFYKPAWTISELDGDKVKKDEKWLVFSGNYVVEKKLVKNLKSQFAFVTTVNDGEAFFENGEDYIIDSGNKENYLQLFASLKRKGGLPDHILFLKNLETEEKYENNKNHAFDSIFYIIQSITPLMGDKKVSISVVTDQIYSITGESVETDVIGGLAIGPCKVAGKEYTNVTCRLIDVNLSEKIPQKQIIDQIIQELCHRNQDEIVSYRNQLRFIPGYQKLDFQKLIANSEGGFKEGGVYLITGGVGDIGFCTAKFLITTYNAKVALVGRTVLPEESQWEDWLHQHDSNDSKCLKIERLKELKMLGQLVYIAADTANYEEMEKAVEHIEAELGTIHGVLHAAGVQGGGMIQLKEMDSANEVIYPKVLGTLVLDKIFKDKKLHLFIVFSSMISIYGVTGQADYVAANAFLDCYAQRAGNKYPDRKTISINWEIWENMGMTARAIKAQGNQVTEFYSDGIKEEEGMRALSGIACSKEHQVFVSMKDVGYQEKFLKEMANITNLDIEFQANTQKYERPELSTEYKAPETEEEIYISEVWQSIFSIDKIGMDDNFYELGGDSLHALSVSTALKKKYTLDITDIFQYPTIRQLAEHLCDSRVILKNQFHDVKKNLNQFDYFYQIDGNMLKKLDGYKKGTKKYESVNLEQKKKWENILLLGSTGYLGIYLLKNLLEKCSAKIYTIVRDSNQNAELRLKEKLEKYFGKNFILHYKDRICLLQGEITQEYFGMDQAEYKKLAEKIDCVVNSAGKVDHYGKYEDFYSINVIAVEKIIAFAKEGRKKEIHHMSTIGVAQGNIPGKEKVLYTEDDTDFGQDIVNYYAATKNIADKTIINARNEGIVSSIYRVGEILCDSKNGKFQENIDKNAIYLMLRALVNLECVPEGDTGVWEFGFVDFISDAVTELMLAKNLLNETYHLFNPYKLELNEWNQVFEMAGIKKKMVSMEQFMDYLYENYENKKLEQYVQDFLIHSNLLELGKVTNYILVGEKTNYLLDKLHISWSKPTKEQLLMMLSYGKSVQFF